VKCSSDSLIHFIYRSIQSCQLDTIAETNQFEPETRNYLEGNQMILKTRHHLEFYDKESCKKEQKTREAGIKMQEFVMAISQKAKSVDSDFIIIPQNGVEVIFNDLNPENELNHAFLNAIDGYGIEELYYDGDFKPDQYKLDMLHKLAPYKPVMVAEYISDNQNITDAVQRNAAE
ncbi:hypothetical protein ANCCEY_15350, partial [Ancylostoma ceylanicum]